MELNFKIKSELIFKPEKNGAAVALDIFYVCDIEKNGECTKENCVCNGGECFMTSNIHFAKRFGLYE